MELDPEQWQLTLADLRAQYHADDHAVLLHSPGVPPKHQPVLLVDATHIETGVTMRLTFLIPPAAIPAFAGAFALLEQDLRSKGALS